MSKQLSTPMQEMNVEGWSGPFTPETQKKAVAALEDGLVLFFSRLSFRLNSEEGRFLSPDVVSGGKNVSYNPANRKLGHTGCPDSDRPAMGEMIHRYSDQAKALVQGLLPSYQDRLRMGRTSLRPVEAAGRETSWRKDDTRLHVDAFPSTPVNGNRILRVFSNVNPSGKPRCWKLGEPFADIAQRFAPGIAAPFPGSTALMQLFRITKGRRSLYDHYMLGLHDAMKSSDDYQKNCPQFAVDLPAQSTWMVFTDQAPHAVTSGQHQLEQTFYLEVAGMTNPEKSPLRILEKTLGRNLSDGN